jgi:hypothetical protein
LDFDALISSGKSQASAITVLKGRKEQYDPTVLAALVSAVTTEVKASVLSIRLADLQDGMVLVEDVHTGAGELLAAKGQTVTLPMRTRFQHLGESTSIKEPLMVVHPPAIPSHGDPGAQALSHFVQQLKAS